MSLTEKLCWQARIPILDLTPAALLITGSPPRFAHGGWQEQTQGAGPALHEPGRNHRHGLRQRPLPPPGPRSADPDPQQEPCCRHGQAGPPGAAPAGPHQHARAGSVRRGGPHGHHHLAAEGTSVWWAFRLLWGRSGVCTLICWMFVFVFFSYISTLTKEKCTFEDLCSRRVFKVVQRSVVVFLNGTPWCVITFVSFRKVKLKSLETSSSGTWWQFKWGLCRQIKLRCTQHFPWFSFLVPNFYQTTICLQLWVDLTHLTMV